MIILNSSPVIQLSVALGGLDALPALYGRVLVPEPVLQELEAGAQLPWYWTISRRGGLPAGAPSR